MIIFYILGMSPLLGDRAWAPCTPPLGSPPFCNGFPPPEMGCLSRLPSPEIAFQAFFFYSRFPLPSGRIQARNSPPTGDFFLSYFSSRDLMTFLLLDRPPAFVVQDFFFPPRHIAEDPPPLT